MNHLTRRTIRRPAPSPRPLLCVIFFCAVCCAPPAPAGAAPVRQDLVAHGSGDRFWLARVTAPDPAQGSSVAGVKTQVYVRSVGESHWLPVRQVEGRVVAMAHRGPQLALLLEDGSWLLASEDTLVTGRPVPGGGDIVDLATSGETLLALARLRAPSATGPATTGAAPTTAPDVTHRLALFALGPAGWANAGDLGVTTAAARGDVSLAVVNGAVLVALRDAQTPEAVRVRRQTPDRAWQDVATLDLGRDAAAFQLLGGGPVPILWVLRRDGGYALNWLLSQGPKTEAVPPRAGVDSGEVAAAVAIERARVAYTAQGKQFERAFDTMNPGPGAGEETRIILPAGSLNPLAFRWVQPLLTVALLFTVVASLRRHRQMQDAMAGAHKLPLAPLGRRLAAGLIDAAPLFTAAAYYWMRWRGMDDPSGLWEDRAGRIVLLVGVALYFLHTTVTEVAFGRTFGKTLCGLKVVALDGERPTPGALLVRNLLRVIDVLVLFFPLVLVLYSPLRQRAGDVAAGTLVVTTGARAESQPDEKTESRESAPAGSSSRDSDS